MSLSSHEAPGSMSAGYDRQSTRFPLRIGVIHGNRMTADLLRAHGETAWGCEVVAAECTGHEGLAAIERNKPDIIVLGHAPPMVDVCSLVPRLKQAIKPAKIIVTAQRVTEYLVHRLAAQPFDGVVEESSEGIDQVRTAIERLREGHRLISPRFAFISARLRSNPNSFPKLLTDRQQEVLICIAHAMENDGVGRCLGMSTRTAERHRNDILRKLGLHSTPRLIRYCIDAGFCDTCVPAAGQLGGGE